MAKRIAVVVLMASSKPTQLLFYLIFQNISEQCVPLYSYSESFQLFERISESARTKQLKLIISDNIE